MLIVYNGTVLTLDENDTVIRNGAVMIEAGSIKETGPCGNILGKYHDAELIDAHGGIIMPGLVNMRMHSRNAFSDGEIGRNAQLAFDKRLTLNAVKLAAFAAALECIRNGVTTVFDSAFVPNDISGTLQTISAAYDESGIRCCLSFETSELLGSDRLRASAEENVDFINYCTFYKSTSVAASFGIGPASEQSDFALQYIRDKAPDGTGFAIRLNSEARRDALHRGCQIERLGEFGLLNGKTLVYGCGELSNTDMETIRSSGAAIAAASVSDVRSGIPGASVDELYDHSVDLCIGTGFAGMDMFEAARNESFYSAVRGRKGAAQVCAKALLKGNPAFAERLLNCRLGRIEPGASADLAVIDVDWPCDNDPDAIIEHLIRCASGRACRHTISRGRVLMKDRQILSVDEQRLLKEIKAARSKIYG